MPVCGYKKIFLKDLAAIPRRYRARIERLVFDQIPVSENIFHDFDIQKRMRNITAFVPDST
jgi:mRNA interferase RelE/StbE